MSNFEVRSKATCIHSSLETFDLLFGIILGEKFYGITDALSHTLKSKITMTNDANVASEAVCKRFLSLRSNAAFDSF